MPSTGELIEKIRTATFGREVRQPIADLLENYHEYAQETAADALENDHSEEYLRSFFPEWRQNCNNEDGQLTQIEEKHETRIIDCDITDLGYSEEIYFEKLNNEDSMVHFTQINRFNIIPESESVIHTGDKVILPFNAYDIQHIARHGSLTVQVEEGTLKISEGKLKWKYIGPSAIEQSAIASDLIGTATNIGEEDFLWKTGELENERKLKWVRNTTE